MRSVLWLLLLAFATACGGQPQPTPAPPPPTAKPAAAAAPSPSPAVAAAASPTPAAAFPVSRAAFAALIDNNVEARPQSGLDGADVVYEAPAEGGIPRLMALFLRDGANVERIGPVRSARHYFVYLAAEYRVALVHIGASPQGFQALDETGLERVDETRGDGGFMREPARQAPHDAYVSTQSVRTELERRAARITAGTAGLSFGTFRPGGQQATQLRLAYPAGGFSAQYDYDAGSRMYQRSQDGQPHVDERSGKRYAARSVIVQQLPVTPIPNDDAGRVDLGLAGNGRGLLLAEGTQVPLQWSKTSLSEATRFTRDDGAPFALPDGQVWIELVPLDAQVQT